MSEIIEKNDLRQITKWRKYLFRAAIWLLIAGVALGAITILVADLDTVGEILGKTVGTIFLASLAMMVSVVGFRMIEAGKKSTQIFSLIGLGSGILAIVLWAISIWAWNPVFYACEPNEAACAAWVDRQNEYQRTYSYTKLYESDDCPLYIREDCRMTWMFRIAMMATYLGLYGLVAAGIMKMYEGKKKDLIRPLKIVAVVLAGYVCFFGWLAALTGMLTGEANFTVLVKETMGRLGMLAMFASVVWILVFLVALVISNLEKNRDGVKKKNEDKGKEMRAEIEEQVRREMIEREVREKLEKERQGVERAERKEVDQEGSEREKPERREIERGNQERIEGEEWYEMEEDYRGTEENMQEGMGENLENGENSDKID